MFGVEILEWREDEVCIPRCIGNFEVKQTPWGQYRQEIGQCAAHVLHMLKDMSEEDAVKLAEISWHREKGTALGRDS